jgi:hypothetical protein
MLPPSWAKLNEFRQAVKRVRASGKTQRINTMYPAKRAINPNQSGITFLLVRDQ